MSVTVLPVGTQHGPCEGTIAACEGSQIELDLHDSDPLPAGGMVVVITGPDRRHRQVACARVDGSEGSRALLELDGAWSDFDARADARYRTDLDASVYLPVTLIDVSSGGLGVAVDLAPTDESGDPVRVHIEGAEGASSLPCRVVGTHREDERLVVHLQFAAMQESEEVFLRQLLGAVRQVLAAGQSGRAPVLAAIKKAMRANAA